jgi:antitoxin component YwqK of YwqJK toxin-antitoxin module
MSYIQNKIHHSVLIFLLILVQYNPIIAQDSINLLDKNGRFHGKYKKFHSNGNLRYTGQFEHGKEVGIFKFYALTGEKNPIVIKEYFPKNDSVMVRFYTFSGNLESEGKMLEKNREGIWKYYFPDGKTLMSVEQFANDQLHGEVNIFYKNGTLTEISHYKNGKLHGNRKRYGEDGKIVEDLNYINGIVDGTAIIYDEKGEIYARGSYEKGLRVGEWEFNINGEWIKTTSPDKIINKK